MVRVCNKCGETKPLTTEYYNLLSSGSWRWVCKLCMAANTRRHYALDPEKVNARAKRYQAQKAAAGGYHNDSDIAEIRRRLGDRCAYCGVALKGAGEVDHIVPISRGGDNSPNNLTLACLPCNRDKHAKTAQEFLNWRRRLGLPVRS
jgi:5-methylcytosine-specific restriction endonuclease McrA